MTYSEALNFLKENKCSKEVIAHCILVSKKSYEIAKKIQDKGFSIDLELARVGGLLHDVGRSKIHNIFHGIEGAKILKEHPLLARIAKTHIGGGITKEEAEKLGLPIEDYSPITIEEKVVCYADKLVQGDTFTTDASEEIKKLENKLGINHPSIERLKVIENEIKKIIG